MRETLVLVEKEDHALAFIDLDSGLSFARVGLPAFPHELVVDAHRGYALVGHYGVVTSAREGRGGSSVFVVDCRQPRIINTLDCAPHGRIHGIGQDGEGRVFALSEADARLLVFENAYATGRAAVAVPTGGCKSHLLTVCGDGRTAFTTNLMSGTVTKVFPGDPNRDPVALATGHRPEGLCLSPDERTLFVTNRGSNTVVAIAVERFAVDALAKVRSDPMRIYPVGADRLLVVFHAGSGIALMSRDLSREIAFLPLPSRPNAACITPDGTRAFVSIGPASSLEVDLASFRVTQARSTGRGPDACYVLAEARAGS